MTFEKVAFVGGGHMTRAIVGGMLQDGYPSSEILIADPFPEQRDILVKELPEVQISADNDEIVRQAVNVVLSVQPQILATVCKKLAPIVQETRPLIISIAAGPRIADIDSWLGGGHAVARVMPNQPALIMKGISGIYANQATTPNQLAAARKIMSAVGLVITVPNECDIDAVTAVSGSGPAYFYLLIDMITKTGVDLGLDKESARHLAIETAAGAAGLARASEDSVDNLIARVRSPGGTTAAALDSLEDSGIRDIFSNAILAARDRATALADEAHETGQD